MYPIIGVNIDRKVDKILFPEFVTYNVENKNKPWNLNNKCM